MAALSTGLAPLRHRRFRFLVSGQLASNLGDALYAVALPWYVLSEHGGVLLLGAVLAAYGVPRMLLLTVGGHAADRWRPSVVMMGADVVRAVAIGLLEVAALTGPAKAVLLLPIAFVLGAGEGLFLPGSFSILPSLLPDADLQAGNALTSGGTQLATLVGPALGGVIVAFAGPAPAFLVDAGSFIVSAATLAGVLAVDRQESIPLAATEPLVAAGALGEGQADDEGKAEPSGDQPQQTLRDLIRSQRVLQIILLVTLAANLGSGGLFEVALPALAHGPFHAGAAGYGGLVAAIGGGALIGTLAAGQTSRLRRPAVVASVAFLVEAAFMAAVPYLGSVLLAGVALAVFGGLNGFGNILTITAFQRWARPEAMGRLMGLVLLAGMGVFPLSVVLGGVVAHVIGPAWFFPISAFALAGAVLVSLTQPQWRAFGSATASTPTTTTPTEEPAGTAP